MLTLYLISKVGFVSLMVDFKCPVLDFWLAWCQTLLNYFAFKSFTIDSHSRNNKSSIGSVVLYCIHFTSVCSFLLFLLYTSIIIQFLESVVYGGFGRQTNNLYTKTNQREITLDRRIIYTKTSQREIILFFTCETFIHCIIALMSSIIWSHYREFEHQIENNYMYCASIYVLWCVSFRGLTETEFFVDILIHGFVIYTIHCTVYIRDLIEPTKPRKLLFIE